MAQKNQNFAAQYGFKLTTCSPYQPIGHGFIDRQIKTIKNILIKCDLDAISCPSMAMLEQMATTLDENTPSPAELLGDRRNITTLPALTTVPFNSEEVK